MINVLLKTNEVIFHTECKPDFMYAAWKPQSSTVPIVLHFMQDKKEYCWVEFNKLMLNQIAPKKFFPDLPSATESVLQAGFTVIQFNNLVDFLDWAKVLIAKTTPEPVNVEAPSNEPQSTPQPKLQKSLGDSKTEADKKSKSTD